MDEGKRLICEGQLLKERGKGVRFNLERCGKLEPAFVIRYGGAVHAYVNRCAHVPVELDWLDGEFWDLTGLYLMCSTHGAMYLPETGRCVGGPCRGGSLIRLPVQESDGKVFLILEQ